MKVLNIRRTYDGMLLILIGGLMSCGPLNYLGLAQTVTPIQELSSPQATDTNSDEEEIIYLEGKVVDRAPLVNSGSYQLQDETGTVWVLTNGELPQTGDQLSIKGKISYQSIPIDGQDVGEMYILEIEKLQNTTPTAQPVSSPEDKPKPQIDTDEFLLPHKRHGK